jgi:hypothetical protein
MSYRLGIFSLALFIFVSVAAPSQTAMQPRIMIEAGPVIRTQTAMVDVRVVIPENRFIPAETKASLTGAWLQVLAPWPWITGQTPTYPIPNSIHLPATNMPILAYSGTVLVHMPVYVPAGIHGPNELVVRFGYELCDARSCTGPATVDAKATLDVQESRPDPNRLAYRVDSQRVAILTDMTAHTVARPGDAIRPIAQFIPSLTIVPQNDDVRKRFKGQLAMGAHWKISSNGPQFDAAVEQAAIVNWDSGGGEQPLAAIAQIKDSAFAGHRVKYFLAAPDGRRFSRAPLSVNLQSIEARRHELESIIDRQMRITMPTLFAPDPTIHNPVYQPKETVYDEQVRSGQARLVDHIEAFMLAPDAQARLYVRAYWQVGSIAQAGMTLWLRFDGRNFSVEQAGAYNFARYAELQSLGSDIAARPEYAGMLLNVIPASDGWAYLIMGMRGYESIKVSVMKYSPNGPRDTGIGYTYGA